jgi:hypothetical protein
MSHPQDGPPPDQDQQAREERFVLKAFLIVFVLAGLIIAAVTIFGGGLGD